MTCTWLGASLDLRYQSLSARAGGGAPSVPGSAGVSPAFEDAGPKARPCWQEGGAGEEPARTSLSCKPPYAVCVQGSGSYNAEKLLSAVVSGALRCLSLSFGPKTSLGPPGSVGTTSSVKETWSG